MAKPYFLIFLIIYPISCDTVLALKIRHPSWSEYFVIWFEAIRAEMEKNVEGDEHLDYSDETLEQRRNFRAIH